MATLTTIPVQAGTTEVVRALLTVGRATHNTNFQVRIDKASGNAALTGDIVFEDSSVSVDLVFNGFWFLNRPSGAASDNTAVRFRRSTGAYSSWRAAHPGFRAWIAGSVFPTANAVVELSEETSGGVVGGGYWNWVLDVPRGRTRATVPAGATFNVLFTIPAAAPTITDRDAALTATTGVPTASLAAERSVVVTAPGRVARPTVGAASTSSLYVSWRPPASDGGSVITAYHVRYRAGSSGDWSTPLIVGGGGAARGRVITALTPGTTYEVEVVAQNRVGTSRWSLPGTGTTTAVATVPARPARPSASSSSTNTMEVVWSAPADGGSAITDYDVRYRAGRTGAWTLHAHTGTDAMVTVDGLQAGTYHEVQVRAENGVGAGPWSLSGSATTGGTAPSAPATVPAQPATPGLLGASPTSIAAVWIAADDGGAAIEDYDVQYRAGNSGPWTSWPHVGTATHTIITGLREATSYFVQVRAENSVGESLWSPLGSAVETLTITARDAALVVATGEPTVSVMAEGAAVPIRDAALVVATGEPTVSVMAEGAAVTDRDAALVASSGEPTVSVMAEGAAVSARDAALTAATGAPAVSVAADIADRDITSLGSLSTGTITRVGEITGHEDHFTLAPRPDNRATDWYNFTLPRAATSLIIRSVSGLDLSGWLYGGTMTTVSALADLTRIAYNDDGGSGSNFQISRSNQAAGDYAIAVQKYHLGSADYKLRIAAVVSSAVNRDAAVTVTSGEPTVSVGAERSAVVHGDASLAVRSGPPAVDIAAESLPVAIMDAALVATSGVPTVAVTAERARATTHNVSFAAESGLGNTISILVLATSADRGSPLKAIIDMLKADPVVVHAVGEITVYGETVPAITGDLDEAWAKSMPRRMVLVREVGGLPKTQPGPLSWPRFDVRCYGADPGGIWDASELSRQIFNRLFGKVNRASGVVAVTLNAGPTSGREPDTGWAYNLRTYDVLRGG